LSQREAAIDDKQWIQHLHDGMKGAGWTPVGPDQTGEGWIAGAVRFEVGSTGARGPTGFGKTATRAVEDLYRQVLGDLPHRPDSLGEGEGFEDEFDGIPQADVSEIRSIRVDFHRHGYDLFWFHPTDSRWIMQWSPHGGEVTPVYGQVEDVGQFQGVDMSALQAARRAWEKFQGMRGGG
jgi:hypothetical protein